SSSAHVAREEGRARAGDVRRGARDPPPGPGGDRALGSRPPRCRRARPRAEPRGSRHGAQASALTMTIRLSWHPTFGEDAPRIEAVLARRHRPCLAGCNARWPADSFSLLNGALAARGADRGKPRSAVRDLVRLTASR